MAAFDDAEAVWADRLGNLRNVVRQELIGRQLAGHVTSGMTVLDVGCGQGTQALRLAEHGCAVTGADPSVRLLRLLHATAARTNVPIEMVQARLDELERVLTGRRFDLVCAHGLLMYLDDRASALRSLTDLVAPHGALSVTFRNGSALAYRPALRRDWRAARDAFDRLDYVNELGVPARADTLDGIVAELAESGMVVTAWYGVRVFTDPAAADEPPPTSAEELAVLLDVEDRAGRTDPYRQLGSQLHVLATRSSSIQDSSRSHELGVPPAGVIRSS